ncbi:related to dehydrogenases with different specificities (related to short-chain alcohol dehydrogenases) [Armillaria ostoyae]|uniref:Related to dehydrogenases with different specificities (Related to short-chain alcohol dehydrogenases) n=1 Tax=Armillaria ostoyae TaxID=47428 RepID=A0A284RUE1_ARMOS|nr:related to dehydrogenases with different specificities (related to short-chain alcohol dehydrogenases) [Armillaria ostoyae]
MSNFSQNQKFTVDALFNVTDWVCVVTGGGTGIGLMIAQAFANNGARVYITGRRQDVLQQAVNSWGTSLVHQKGKIIGVPCDHTSKESIQALVETISRQEKHVDVLVNNAGIATQTADVEKGEVAGKDLAKEMWQLTPDHWLDVYKTNVMGHYFTSAAFLPLLSAASSSRSEHTGTVINISSISGITTNSQHQFQHNVSKAASIQLTTLLAQEFRRPGVSVRVNSIAPGVFPSEMTTSESDEHNKSSITSERGYNEGIPAGRAGRDEDMAQAALMLATNQYAYGQTIVIDGGYLLVHG